MEKIFVMLVDYTDVVDSKSIHGLNWTQNRCPFVRRMSIELLPSVFLFCCPVPVSVRGKVEIEKLKVEMLNASPPLDHGNL